MIGHGAPLYSIFSTHAVAAVFALFY